jgi:hypothetical protein
VAHAPDQQLFSEQRLMAKNRKQHAQATTQKDP